MEQWHKDLRMFVWLNYTRKCASWLSLLGLFYFCLTLKPLNVQQSKALTATLEKRFVCSSVWVAMAFLLGHLAILFNRHPKPEACWSNRSYDWCEDVLPWPGFVPRFSLLPAQYWPCTAVLSRYTHYPAIHTIPLYTLSHYICHYPSHFFSRRSSCHIEVTRPISLTSLGHGTTSYCLRRWIRRCDSGTYRD